MARGDVSGDGSHHYHRAPVLVGLVFVEEIGINMAGEIALVIVIGMAVLGITAWALSKINLSQ